MPGAHEPGHSGSVVTGPSGRAREGVSALHARERMAVELAGQALWIADVAGRLVEPGTWPLFTGQSADDALARHGTGWLDAVHPDDRERLRAQWQECLSRRLGRLEYLARVRRERAADLIEWREALFRAAPVTDAGGATREWVMVVTDVGDRDAVLARAGASEARFRALAETLPQAVWIATAEGELVYVNRRFEDVTGLSADEIVGEGWMALLHPDDRAPSLQTWERAVQALQPFEIEHRIIGVDGHYHWMLSLALPLRDPAGAVTQWVGTATDIDERKRAEEERERLLDAELEARLESERQRAKAERARGAAEVARREAESARRTAEQANAAKDQFLAAMSHELRTPLNAIAGYAQILDMGLAGPVTGEQHEALERIARAEQHLLAIINDILQFAKLESGQAQLDVADVPVAELCEQVSALVARDVAAKRLAYACRVREPAPPEGPLVVRGDRARLRQILHDLVENAVKYTESAGRVDVEAFAEGEHVLVHVRDTGRGIPADRLEAVFEPFVQIADLRAGREGVGLGLALGRDLARRMGGDITVESTVGRGSTFTLRLPRPHGDAEPG
jgi:PAS domain S-box-containing protein